MERKQCKHTMLKQSLLTLRRENGFDAVLDP